MAVDYLTQIQDTIDFIEDNLNSDLRLEDISDRAGLSMYHFLRVFQSMAGESPCDYLRRRRLSAAAQQLLSTNDRILDVALQYQFGSQEAFTRSFKALFGLTPGKYRNRRQSVFIEKPRLTLDHLIHLRRGLTLEPSFVDLPEYSVIGLKSCSTFSDNHTEELWDNFDRRKDEIQNASQPYTPIGIYEYLSNVGFTCDTLFCYVAGVAVDSLVPVPQGMICKTIPAARYAVFHQKDISFTREEAYKYIFGTWFPKSNCELVELDTIEIFHSPAPGCVECECSLCIPIK